jgi:hypothetical protein
MAKATKTASKKTSVQKLAVKKSKPVKSETGIKYSDKSGDQPELVPVFNEIKKLLLPYGKDKITIRGGTGGQIVLVNEHPVVIDGKPRDEYWFAAALVQRGYVGFYFMPVKTEKEKKEVFKPELLKCLKGKSCFHIKTIDAVISTQIAAALEKGYAACRKRGLV